MGIVAFVALMGFIIWTEPPYGSFRCPNDYRTAEEYLDGLAKWASVELKKSPDITQEEMLAKRESLFIGHECEVSRWGGSDINTDAKNGTYQEMPSILQSADYGKDFKMYESDLGFSFKYPPHLVVRTFPDDPSHLYIVPSSRAKDSKEPLTSIIISVSDPDPEETPEEWLLGPNSGYTESLDRYGNYYKTSIDGQNAVYTDGGMWVVVNTRNNKYRLSIADLTEKDTSPLFTEMGIVIESLTFKKIPVVSNEVVSEFYGLPAEKRNQMLVEMIYAGEYKAVVNATNDGIEKYRDLVWEDLDFWIHRGVALFQLGNCAESGAAFYHVAVRVPEDKMVSSMMAKITNEGCKTPLDFSQQ